MQLDISSSLPRGAGIRRVALLRRRAVPPPARLPPRARRSCAGVPLRRLPREGEGDRGRRRQRRGAGSSSASGKAPATPGTSSPGPAAGRPRGAAPRREAPGVRLRSARRRGGGAFAAPADRRARLPLRALRVARRRREAAKVRGTVVVGPDADRRQAPRRGARGVGDARTPRPGPATSATRRPTTSARPSSRARPCRRWRGATGCAVRVFDKKRIEQERMAGLLAVNSGSVRPAAPS